MDKNELVKNICDFIAIPSVAPKEKLALEFLEALLKRNEDPSGNNFTIERIPIGDGRYNLFAYVGVPKIVFTTHIDVVPAPEELFFPRVENEIIYGRGACDTKSIGILMLDVCLELLKNGERNFGLLYVVDEEVGGLGARTFASVAQNHGIEFLINGEPTGRKCFTGHKGGLGLEIEFYGKSVHSGYPDLGEDANLKLIDFCSKCTVLDLGNDALLGKSTITFGVISGGCAANMISDFAKAQATVRTVIDNAEVIARVKKLLPTEKCEMQIVYNADAVTCLTVPEFSTEIGNYCTDLSFFKPLGVKSVLFGPGEFKHAHSLDEQMDIRELLLARNDYFKIFEYLKCMEKLNG